MDSESPDEESERERARERARESEETTATLGSEDEPTAQER